MTVLDKFKFIIKDFETALKSLQSSLEIDFSNSSDIVIDTLKNGQIQKFEIASELCWKASKIYVEVTYGEIVLSPKSVYKKLFLEDKINGEFLEQLLLMVDGRNQLSHVYKQEIFDHIYPTIKNYCSIMVQLLNLIK